MRRAGQPVLVLLALANLGAWAWAGLAFRATPALFAIALLAWLFGLRHAADADHIAAIDNAVRKLLRDGKNPAAAGLFFSLGHSTVVVILAALAALAAGRVRGNLHHLAAVGAYAGTGVSVLFLVIIGLGNLLALHHGHSHAPRGLLTRLLRPFFAMVRRGSDMYVIGFLFGLGFDTASEIGLLALSAAGAAHGLAFWRSMALPALFTAGMSLIDTADSVVMTRAYVWALRAPGRRRGYNIVLTSLSAAVALLTGTMEALGLLGPAAPGRSAAWNAVLYVNNHWSATGAAIILLLLVVWLGALGRRRIAQKSGEHA